MASPYDNSANYFYSYLSSFVVYYMDGFKHIFMCKHDLGHMLIFFYKYYHKMSLRKIQVIVQQYVLIVPAGDFLLTS